MDEAPSPPAPATPPAGDRPLSPDGRYYWDGTAWQPVPWKSLFEGPAQTPGQRRRTLGRTALLSSGLGLAVCAMAILAIMLVLGAALAGRVLHHTP